MPKRAAPTTEESPRKVTRKNSKSPAKASIAVPVAVDPVEPAVEPAATAASEPAPEDPALTNISDDEMEVATAGKEAEVRRPSVPCMTLEDLWLSKQKFFEAFLNDISRDEGAKVDLEVYKALTNERPEEDEVEKRGLVDQHLKDFVIDRVVRDRENWDKFLELSILLAQDKICSASQPIQLISDLMDLSKLHVCEEIFEFVEKRLDTWKEPIFLNSGKNSVLRMCNDLLRRLSGAQNTIFCGRILLFLSNYFPFSERSGLNIMSEFNADNLTTYKKGDGSEDPEDKMEVVEETDEKLFEGTDISVPGLDKIVSMTQAEKKKKVKIDYSLYVKFWSLQDFFRNPAQCYNKISWKSFTLYIQDVLGAFTSFKVDHSQKTHANLDLSVPNIGEPNKGHNSSSINVVPKLSDEDLYFPKYLTNRRLLELQMGDPSFRKYFLVQLLIILQYLTTPIKFKSESQQLSDDQVDFVKKTTDKVFSLLKEMKGGKEFVKSVQHILKREDLWSKWKNDGCQPFKKPVSGPADEDGEALDGKAEEPVPVTPSKKRHLGDIMEEADKNGRFLLGNSELSRLWNICGDNLAACRAESRDFCPSIETFFAEAFKELDPEPTAPHILLDPSKREVKQKKNLSNANFGWRALRLLARNSQYFFQLAPSPPIQPMQNYLEYILKKIAQDMEIPQQGQMKEGKEVIDEDTDSNSNKPETPPASQTNESDQVMESVADDNDELLKVGGKDDGGEEDREEGEVDQMVRNLTEEEQKAVGRLLGDTWKKLAAKLQFSKDEIEYFITEKGKEAGAWMLKIWTDNEKDDATAADLLYQLEGLKLRELVRSIFP